VAADGLSVDDYKSVMAEREGFEPPIALRLCLISRRAYYTLLSIIYGVDGYFLR